MSSFLQQQARSHGLVAWDGQMWTVDGVPEEDARAQSIKKYQSAKRQNSEGQAVAAQSADASVASATGTATGATGAATGATGATSTATGATGAATGATSAATEDNSYVPAQAMLTCWYSLNRCVKQGACARVCVMARCMRSRLCDGKVHALAFV